MDQMNGPPRQVEAKDGVVRVNLRPPFLSQQVTSAAHDRAAAVARARQQAGTSAIGPFIGLFIGLSVRSLVHSPLHMSYAAALTRRRLEAPFTTKSDTWKNKQ